MFMTQKNYFMPSSSFTGSLATFKAAISFDRALRDLAARKSCHHFLFNCKREWSFSSQVMEITAVSSRFNEKRSIDCSTPAKEENLPTGKKGSASVFINHAEIDWHENRKKWIGDESQRPERMDKDPILSWSTTYDDLLSNNEPFSEPIPLPEMVDFLVDIWHDEGLFD
ncbi:hypothetical protein Ddye_028878 [Dipteronia dyeriana]|uniref:Gag1-like clamp domain-containing protein n=1 Tax=Dipteronia dyeriana TaxID=168575 RepID=A0AAD9TE74_9ROSI|nr:hypothetical protein Ddye_028878 [Dipteronia dyeriana]